MKPLKNGLGTGLILQLSLGPVFFYILSLTIDKSLYDGLMGVLAVTIVDTMFILFAIFGTKKIIENKKSKTIFSIISSIVLLIFGYLMFNSGTNIESNQIGSIQDSDLLKSFTSTFIITIVNPLTIIFFSSLFTSKAIEKNYTKIDLYYFGLGTILATIIFMAGSVFVFSSFKSIIPLMYTNLSKKFIGAIIVGYGLIRLKSTILGKTSQVIG